jgi:aminoglycoside N3'-acetyltransferase
VGVGDVFAARLLEDVGLDGREIFMTHSPLIEFLQTSSPCNQNIFLQKKIQQVAAKQGFLVMPHAVRFHVQFSEAIGLITNSFRDFEMA